MEYKRWKIKEVEAALKTRRVLIISGARQVGKTTLTTQLDAENVDYKTLDDSVLLEAAKDDPVSFLKHSKKTLVIDEIQKAPLLVSEIKKIVDKDKSFGQFILTGSADIKRLPTVSESMAGRVKHIRLRPLSYGEINGCEPNFVKNVLVKNFKDEYDCSKEDVVEKSLKGGYAEPLLLSVRDGLEWYKDYLSVLIEHDLRDFANVQRIDVLADLIKTISSWSSKYMDIGGICSGYELSRQTLTGYINVLKQLYLCEGLPAWIRTDYDRVGKKDKLYMTDTGFMASILRWNIDDLMLDKDRCGKLVETFVYTQLVSQIEMNSDYILTQFRDRNNHEIDFIVEDYDENIIGIEVKAGSNVGKSDFNNLKWFKENLVKNKKFTGIILYSGKNTVYFGADLIAVPLSILWS